MSLFVEVCIAGREIAVGATTCSDCPFDYYQPIDNPMPEVDLCIACPDNKGTMFSASSALSNCTS